MSDSAINIIGYDLLGDRGKDGIRFAWEYDSGKFCIESAAFPQRSATAQDDICGYTTSVSAGCILCRSGSQCTFCRTGNLLPFCGLLSYRDIVKQNVFMVLADINCKSHPELHYRPREFAYMGQGEPGLSYSQVRQAIELTNLIMKKIGQSVHRHIFATSGIPDAIASLKNDINNFYTERVTLHFSLHATNNRDLIMPINLQYHYKEVLEAMDGIHNISGEKPCVGVLLFNEFQAQKVGTAYSNMLEDVKKILEELDPKKHRLSFCEYNASHDIGTSVPYSHTDAVEILDFAKQMGFEAKLFSSFGQKEETACGMLGGKLSQNIASQKWKAIEDETMELIDLYDSNMH